jgi:hypothetical protein
MNIVVVPENGRPYSPESSGIEAAMMNKAIIKNSMTVNS